MATSSTVTVSAPVLTSVEVKTQEESSFTLAEALSAARERFVQRNPRSLALHEKALNHLPGGNTRSLLHTFPFPVSLASGTNYKVTDEDGHEYLDLVGELTAALFGHSHPLIQKTLIDVIQNVGLNLGGTTAQEGKHAALMCERFNLEQARFTNSGTEANLHALGAARRYTEKNKVVVFEGGYHGAVLSFGDGGCAENNVDKQDWIIAKYNDLEDAREKTKLPGVAAVILEAMQGAGGCIPARDDFLHGVQEAAKEAGVIFILDEVMTSRLAPGGIQSLLNLQPDLTTLGKYLGGGMAFGAFGGRADIMAVYDPRSPTALAHSGTFNNNTLAMTAGYIGLKEIFHAEAAVAFNALGDRFRENLLLATQGTKIGITGRGCMVAVHFCNGGTEEMRTKGSSVDEIADLKDLFWTEMVERGFWMTRRGQISLILGTPEEELDRFVEVVKGFAGRYARFLTL